MHMPNETFGFALPQIMMSLPSIRDTFLTYHLSCAGCAQQLRGLPPQINLLNAAGKLAQGLENVGPIICVTFATIFICPGCFLAVFCRKFQTTQPALSVLSHRIMWQDEVAVYFFFVFATGGVYDARYG